MIEVVPFDQLPNADLTVEAIYEGGNTGDMRDDPLGRLIPVGNQGGRRFRYREVMSFGTGPTAAIKAGG